MNVGVLCFRFIDDKMPLQKTTRRESFDFIQEHILPLLIKSTSSAYVLMSSGGRCGKLCLKSRRAASG